MRGSKGRDLAGVFFFLGAVGLVIVVGLAAMALTRGGAAEPVRPAMETTPVHDTPENAGVTFYVMAYHWDYAIFMEDGSRLDTITVPQGTSLEIFAVNGLAQDAIARLPAPVAEAMRKVPRPDAEAILAAEPGPHPWPVVDHGFLLDWYGVTEYLAADAQEPNRVVFTADRPGEYEFVCTNYCGAGHTYMTMRTRFIVQPFGLTAPTPTPEREGRQPDGGAVQPGPLLSPTPERGGRQPDGGAEQPGPLLSPTPERGGRQPDGGAELGRQIFTGDAGVVSPPCSVCHAVGRPTVGPDLAGIATRAAGRVQGLTGEDYLRQAVLEPRAYVVESWPNIMPSYQGQMTDDQLKALIAYLMTLE